MCPSSCTLYNIEQDIGINILYDQIDQIDYEETTSNGINLRTWVTNLHRTNESLFTGVLHYHDEVYFPMEGRNPWVPVENTKNFGVIRGTNLIIFDKVRSADKLANKFNGILFPGTLTIRNLRFDEGFIRTYLRTHPHQSGLVFMSGLGIPNADSSAIYGGSVEDSDLYKQALEYGGQHAYMQIRFLTRRLTIGLSKKGSIVFYTQIPIEEMMRFIDDEIL